MIWELAAVALGTMTITILAGVWLHARTVGDLRARYEERIGQVHADYEMQRRVYGSVPVEDLVGREQP